VPDGRLIILPQVPLKPPDALAADDMVRIDYLLETIQVCNVPTDNDHGCRLMLPDQLAHLFDLADIRENAADADNVIDPVADFFREAVKQGKIQDCAGGFDVGLNHHQSEGAVKHPQGESSLDTGDLILVEFHWVDRAAPVLVIPGVRSEDARQQDAGACSERMDRLILIGHDHLLSLRALSAAWGAG
jgi:hypothetical protein